MSRRMSSLDQSVERRVRGEAKKEVFWPKSMIVTQEMLDDPEFMEKYPNAVLHGEIFDPVPLFLRVGEKRAPTIIDQIRNEIRMQQVRQQVVEDHFEFDAMSVEEKRAFFEDESDFELPDDHPSIISAYEKAGLVYGLKDEYPVSKTTPLNQT